MKARLYNVDKTWVCVIPPQDLFYNEDIPSEEYAKKYAISIYKLEEIKEENKQNWKNNKWIEGNIVGDKKVAYFKIEGVSYEENIKKENLKKSIFACEVLLGNNQRVPITKYQFDLIKNIAKEENTITSEFSNGFSLYGKYIFYGKLTKDNEVIYPQLKIK